MKVLVTGAAGFVGSHLVAELVRAGHEVVSCDNFDPYYDLSAKAENAGAVAAVGGRVEVLDVRRLADVQAFVDAAEPDAIVHLAGKAGVRNSVEHPVDYFETNTMGTQAVLEAARRRGGCHVVIASTSSIYAGCDVIPFPETFAGDRPLQPYAASKRSAELMAYTYTHLYDVTATIARFFTVYGPRGRPDMMPMKLARSISHGDEVQVFEGGLARDWTFVEDVAIGLRLAVERPLGFQILNLGRGEPVGLDSFIETIEARAGRSANLRRVPCPPSEMTTTFADISTARDLIGFDPRVSVAEGVDRFWEWYEGQL